MIKRLIDGYAVSTEVLLTTWMSFSNRWTTRKFSVMPQIIKSLTASFSAGEMVFLCILGGMILLRPPGLRKLGPVMRVHKRRDDLRVSAAEGGRGERRGTLCARS